MNYSDYLESNSNADSSYSSALDKYGIRDNIAIKSLDVSLSFDEKIKFLEDKQLEKTFDINDFDDVIAIYVPDSDSFTIIDKNGNKYSTRMVSGSNIMLDAVDSLETFQSDGKKSNVSELLQRRAVAKMVGKTDLNSLTTEEFSNVKNYQTQQFISSLTNKDHKFEPYDKNKVYDPIDTSNTHIPIKVRIVGQEQRENGTPRYLVEAVNPLTGRNLSFDMANNPYLNARFSLAQSMNTYQNRKKLLAYEKQHQSIEDFIAERTSLSDYDGRLMEDVDLAQSTAYQSAARVLQHIPGADKEYWSQVANSETGQFLADLAVGVNPETRKEFSRKAQEISDSIEKGDYADAAITAFSQIDRFLAESAPQIGLLIAGSAIAAPIAGGMAAALGTGTAAVAATKATQLILGASLAGLDKTLADVEDFKTNNGRSMTAGEFATTLAGSIATLIPEEIVLGIFGKTAKTAFGSALSRALGKGATETATKTVGQILGNTAKNLATAGVTEYVQEGLEGAWDRASSKKRDEKYEGFLKEAFKEWNTAEGRQERLIGAVMGLSLGGAVHSVTTPLEIHNNKKLGEYLNNVQHNFKNQTAEDFDPNVNEQRTSKNLDVKASNEVLNQVNNHSIATAHSTTTQISAELTRLEKLRANNVNINGEAATAIDNKVTELLNELASRVKHTKEWKNAKTEEEKIATAKRLIKQQAKITPEEAFNKIVYGAKPQITEGVDPVKGTKLSKEAVEAKKEELRELGKTLGISKENIEKTINSVNSDIRYGYNGFQTALDNLAVIREESKKNPKADYQAQITRNLKQIAKLLAYQSTKLHQLANTAESISNEDKASTQDVVFPSGEKFTLIGEVLAAQNYEKGEGTHGVIHSIAKDIADIKKAIKGLSKKESSLLRNAIVDFNNSNKYGLDYKLAESTDEALEKYKNAVALIQSKSTARFKKKLETSTNNSENLDIYPVVRSVERLTNKSLGELSPKKHLEMVNRVRTLNENQVERLKKHIEDSKRTDEKKAKMLETIDNILDSNTKSEAIAKEKDTKNAEFRDKAKKFLNDVNADTINNLTLDTVDKIKEIRSQLQDILSTFKNTNGDEDSEILSKLHSLNTLFNRKMEILRELAKRETQKKQQEETKKAESKPKQESKSKFKKVEPRQISFKERSQHLFTKITGIRKSFQNSKPLAPEALKKLHNEIREAFIDIRDKFPKENLENLKTAVVNLLKDIRSDINKAENPQNSSQKPSNKSSKVSQTNTQKTKEKPLETKSEGSVNIWYGSNENSELSNLAERPFTYEGKQYRSVEHAYQTLKSGKFDATTYTKYQKAKEGSKITGKPANTKDNANIKLMKALILASFQQNEQAKQALLATGNKTLTHAQDKGLWGKVFPKLLTEVRNELRASKTKSEEFTLHSGGAEGADTVWDTIAKQFGIKAKHYFHKNGKIGNIVNAELSDAELREGMIEAKETNKVLGRTFPTSSKFSNALIARDWFQVKHADAVFAVSRISNGLVQGGTGWAVHMAINHNKPVYVFNQVASKNYPIGWYTYDNQSADFVPLNKTPILTQNFAGVGTRKINNAGKAAIRDVFEATFNQGKNELSENAPETKPEQKSFVNSPIDGTRPEYKTEIGDVFASADKDGTIRFFTYKNGKLRCGNVTQFFAYIKGTSNTKNKTTKAVSEQKKVVFDNLTKLGYTEEFLRSILTTPEIIRDFILFHEKSHLRHEDARVYVTNDLMHTTNIDIETRATLEGLQELGKVYPEIAKKLEQISNSSKIDSKPSSEQSEVSTQESPKNALESKSEPNLDEEAEFIYDDEFYDNIDEDGNIIDDVAPEDIQENIQERTQEQPTEPDNRSDIEKFLDNCSNKFNKLVDKVISNEVYGELVNLRLTLRDTINKYRQKHEIVDSIIEKGRDLYSKITNREKKLAQKLNYNNAKYVNGILPFHYTDKSSDDVVLKNDNGLINVYVNENGEFKLQTFEDLQEYLNKDFKDVLNILKTIDIHSSKNIVKDFEEYQKVNEEYKKTNDKQVLKDYADKIKERTEKGETTLYHTRAIQSLIDIAIREDMTNADKKALKQEVAYNIRTFVLLLEKAKMRYNINEKSNLQQRTQVFVSALEEYTGFSKHNFYVEDIVSKNSPISRLLDAENNSTVTLSPSKSIENFNLNDEVVIRAPECVLATTDKIYSNTGRLKDVKKIAAKINLGELFNKPKRIDFPKSYLTKPTTKYLDEETGQLVDVNASFLEQSPHYQFIYRIMTDPNSQNVTFVPNDFVLQTIDFSIKEYIATMGLTDKLTKEMPKSAVARMFGLNDETLDYGQIGKLRKLVREYGIPKNAIANAIGGLILRNLGIRHNKETGTREFYARLTSGFGLFAMQYMKAAGILTYNKIPSKLTKEFGTTFNVSESFTAVDTIENGELIETDSAFKEDKTGTPTIKITENGHTILERYKYDFLGKPNSDDTTIQPLKDFKIKSSHSSEPRWKKTKIKETNYVRHTEDLIEVPEVVQNVMDKLSNNAYEFDEELTASVLKNKNKLKYRLGFVDTNTAEFEQLSLDERNSIEGRNLDIMNEIESMESAFNEQLSRKSKEEFDGIYFNWFMSKNGRLFIDSTTLNPQVNKTQRFLCMPSIAKASFDINNEEHLAAEAYAIAQAFDVLDEDTDVIAETIRSLSYNQLKALQGALLNKDGAAFKAWSKKALGVKLGIENLGQCLNVVQHLMRRNQANGSVFDTWLAIENDSTTSGYAIRFLNIPFDSVINVHGPKTGILSKNTISQFNVASMHELKKSAGFLDIYKTIAKDAVVGLPTKEDIDRKDFLKNLYFSYFKDSNTYLLDGEYLASIYRDLFAALPKAEEDGSVSKALRTLMKPAVMTFGYTAGDNSIIRKLASELVSGDDGFIPIYTRYMASGLSVKEFANKIGKSEDHVNAIINAMNKISKKRTDTRTSLLHQLQTKTIGEISINLSTVRNGESYNKQVTLDKYFMHLLYPTVGKSVTNALNESFARYKEINDYMNYMTVNMFNLFNEVYKVALNKAQDKHGKLTTAQYKTLIDSLKNVLPAIDLGYGKNITRNDGRILLTGFEKSYSEKIKAFNYETDKSQSSMHVNMKTFANPRKSGAVIPVHGVDGMILLLTMMDSIDSNNNVAFTPVHDAIVMSALDGLNSTRNYNSNMYLVNKEYNIFGEVFSKFTSIAQAYEAYRQADKDSNLPSLDSMYARTSFGETINSGTIATVSYAEALSRGYITKKQYDNAAEKGVNDGTLREKYDIDKVYADFNVPMTVQSLLSKAKVFNKDITEARDAFYDNNNTIHIMNMDGQKGTNVVIDSTHPDSVTEAALVKKVQKALDNRYKRKYGATASSFATSGQTARLLQDAKTDKKARIQLLHALNGVEYAKGNTTLDPEHMKRLEAILERIDPSYLEDLKVMLSESTHNDGNYSPSDNLITLYWGTNATQLDPVTKAAIDSNMSLAEIYAHELTHAGLEYAFSQNLRDRSLYAKEIRQLTYLHTEASAHVTWEDFMPEEGTYDESLKDMHEKVAKETYNYIFKNPDKNNPLAGLAEFCAYGVTNPRLMKKLSSITTTAKKQQTENILIRLCKAIKALFSAAFNKQKVGELFPYLLGVTKGVTSLNRKQNLQQELDAIVGKLHSADVKATNSLLRHPVKVLEYTFKVVDLFRRFGNNIIRPVFNFVWYMNDNFKIFKEADLRTAKIGISGLDTARNVGISTLLFAVSSTHRRYLRNIIINALRISYTSTVGSFIQDVTATDADTDELQLLGLQTRLIDAASKQREADMTSILINSFGRELNQLEEESLHDVVLKTDLQSLLDDNTSLSNIISMLKDKNEVKARISGIESLLEKESGYNKQQLTWVLNQCHFLARYMTTGIGCECLNLNARQIAKGIYCPIALNTADNDKVIKLIDKLTTLYALNNSNEDMKSVVVTLSTEGLDTFLAAHKTFVKDSYEGIEVADTMNGTDTRHPIEAQHVVKGYTKQLFDTSYEIRVEYADKIMEEILAKEGFVKQKVLPKNKLTKAENPMAIYRREYATPRRRDGAAFITTSSNAFGTSLMDNAYNSATLDSISVTGYELWKRYRARGARLSQKLSKKMTEKLISDEEMSNLSAGYVPIYSPKTNNATDFRISMEHQTKKEILGADTRGITVLSKMYATQLTKLQAEARNEAILQFLINDAKKNYDRPNRAHGKHNAIPYVKLSKNSPIDFIKDAYNSMPKVVQDYIGKNDLYVREDWLRMLFGTPTASVNDIKVMQRLTGIRGKRAISMAESFLRFLSSEVKRKVVNMPKVVVGNIMSNFTYSSIMQGRDPAKVFRMQIENARNIRLYTTLTHEYNQLELKRRMGKAEPNVDARLTQLARQIERNPVAPLVERGFYQSIVEDIKPADIEATGNIHKYFKNNKVFKKIPDVVKTVGKNIYMTEGTPIYDFLFTVTQYSDFVARATEYQLLMEKAPSKKDNYSAWEDYEKQATRSILNTFINYDRPQSTFEQYLNDHGITWFTKFAKRIQPIINGQILSNPMGVLGMLLFQHSIYDAESIVEQNMFSKHWSYLFRPDVHNTFLDAITPMSYTTFIK